MHPQNSETAAPQAVKIPVTTENCKLNLLSQKFRWL